MKSPIERAKKVGMDVKKDVTKAGKNVKKDVAKAGKNVKQDVTKAGRKVEKDARKLGRDVKKAGRDMKAKVESKVKEVRQELLDTGEAGTALASRTKQQLYNRARQLGIEGRSRMNKSALVAAIRGKQ